MGEAVRLARGRVAVGTAGRFRPERLAVSDDEPLRSPCFPQQTPIKRSDPSIRFPARRGGSVTAPFTYRPFAPAWRTS
jgi:hypothetical protein